MEIEEIKRLIQLMVENDLSELAITDGEKTVSLKRGAAGAPVVVQAPAPAPAAEASPSTRAPQEASGAGLLEVRSPMVGTFYAAASPDTNPLVTIGTAISEDTPVCIIEAMKVMNEIKAECAGTVVEICVRNAQPVEYGQVLYRLRPE